MRIDKIVVLADKKAELQLHVFVRSLRDVGCKLPVWIIPFKARDFEPPTGSQWIDAGDSKLLAFLRQNAAHPLYCKYIALLQNHCAYFDTDIILLRGATGVVAIGSFGCLRGGGYRMGEESLDLFGRFAAVPNGALFLLAIAHLQFGFLCF